MKRTNVNTAPRKKTVQTSNRASSKRPAFPFLNPEYPLKPWVTHTGESFQTVSALLDDGRYLAFVLENPRIRHTAKTRKAAEDAVKLAFSTRSTGRSSERNPAGIPYDDEDARMDDEDYRIGEQRKREGHFLTLEEFRAWAEKTIRRRRRLGR